MKIITNQKIISLLGISSLLFAIACSSGPTQPQKVTDNEIKATPQNDTAKAVNKGVKSMAYPPSAPVEITKMLNETGAAYISGTTNNPKNASKYIDSKKKALNIGIYGVDLSYASTYNQSQEATNFVVAAQQLSEQIGIANAYGKNVGERINTNLENLDSLHYLISESFEKTYSTLSENGKGNIASLILAGGWIEGVYLATQLANTAQDREKLFEQVYNQKSSLMQLIATMEMYGDDQVVAQWIASLTEVQPLFVAKADFNDAAKEKLTLAIEALRAKAID